MWIRWLEWRSADDEGNLRARTPEEPHGLPEGILDATDVEATLEHVAEVAGERPGEFVLELVAATEDDRDVLANLLDPLTNEGDDVATYLVATEAPRSAVVYRVEGGEFEQQRGYLTSHLIQMLPPTMGDDRPLLYVTRVRIVAGAAFLLVNWMVPGGYPEAPDPRRVKAASREPLDQGSGELRWPMDISSEGPVEAARAAGIADEVIGFERGPHQASLRRLGELDGAFAATPSAPRRLAERMVAELASSMSFTAQNCGEALQKWEAAFLGRTVEQEPFVPLTTPDSYRRLAAIADLVGPVRNCTDQLNSPTSHEPLHWFAPTPDSEKARQSLESAARSLDMARDDYRTALAVAAGIATSQQLELQSRNQAQRQAFERAVALAGSVVLVPGLVATFYGANVPLPGGDSWWGTGLVLLLMVLAGCATWVGLTRPRPAGSPGE